MKKLQGVLCFMVAFAILLVPCVVKADEECEAHDEQTFTEALGNGECSTINLKDNVQLSANVGITKTVTINGNGYAISATDAWYNSSNGGDQSLLTAATTGDVTLTNITLKHSQKYGVQAYAGGKVTLDGVTIEDCKFGGVLVNAGTVNVKNLTLGSGNGTDGYNGIELSVGDSAAAQNTKTDPKLVLDGKLTSSETENVIHVATNDKEENFKAFVVENTETSEEKIFVGADGKVIVTDKDNQILYTSNVVENIKATQSEDAKNIYIVTIKYGEKQEQIVVEEGQKLSNINLTNLKNAFEGQTFVNFTDDEGKAFDESTLITANITLTANYKIVEAPTETTTTTVASAQTTETTENPKTIDNILLYVSMGIVSLVGCAFATKYLAKKVKAN